MKAIEEIRMIKALLFDLDGTLLSSDVETFMRHYFQVLTPKFAHLFPAERLVEQIMSSTRAMIGNTDPAKTNREAFVEDFFPRIGYSLEELMPTFDDFYAHDFAKLRAYVKAKPEARPTVEEAFAQGYEVVIATNPLFPMTAIRQRLDWVGMNDFDYKLITAFENMHFCKPHPEYYEEIATEIGHRSEECMMVGNYFEEDIVPALEAGMKTFWVTDDVRSAGSRAELHGSLADFKRLLESGDLE